MQIKKGDEKMSEIKIIQLDEVREKIAGNIDMQYFDSDSSCNCNCACKCK